MALVSVLVCTSSRQGHIAETVRCVLDGDYAEFEVVVVDQGCSRVNVEVMSSIGNPRVRYLQTKSIGLPAARNLGTASCRGALVAVTDDDCLPKADWLTELVRPFADLKVGAVFGNVLAGSHDSTSGFVPSYVRHERLVVRSVLRKHLIEGMGACFAFRRSVWSEFGGFDPLLGKGALMRSAGETDFCIRILLNGGYIVQAPEAEVVHNGFRDWSEGEKLVEGYLWGVGALYVKWLKTGHLSVFFHVLAVAYRFLFGGQAVHLGGRNRFGPKLRAFFAGARAGLVHPVDARHHFVETSTSHSS